MRIEKGKQMHHGLTGFSAKTVRHFLVLGAGSLLLWTLYALIFLNSGTTDLPRAATTALVNVLPLVMLAMATEHTLKRWVMGRSMFLQAAWHSVLAGVFGIVWYAAVVVGLACMRGLQGEGFELVGFTGPAVSWQTFQGLSLYATVAAICYVLHRGSEPVKDSGVCRPYLERCIVRIGDDLVPVRTDEIVCLQGAHDYVQLVTPGAKHLVRQTLGDFQQRLDPERFIRVHRSTVVNLDHVIRIEPVGGGRMRAVLSDGSIVPASRSGTQLLRSLTV